MFCSCSLGSILLAFLLLACQACAPHPSISGWGGSACLENFPNSFRKSRSNSSYQGKHHPKSSKNGIKTVSRFKYNKQGLWSKESLPKNMISLFDGLMMFIWSSCVHYHLPISWWFVKTYLHNPIWSSGWAFHLHNPTIPPSIPKHLRTCMLQAVLKSQSTQGTNLKSSELIAQVKRFTLMKSIHLNEWSLIYQHVAVYHHRYWADFNRKLPTHFS